VIPTRARRRPAGVVLLPAFVAMILAGCGVAATPVPAPVGPSPTAVIAPVATGTPIPATPVASPSPSPLPATYPLSLTDDEGTAVTIAARPTTIVSLTPATTEILFAVGAGPRVRGVTDADDYPPAAKQITAVVKLGAVDVEKIVGLDANLVIAGGNGFNSPDAIAKLRSLGIPVVVVYAANVAGVFKDIELVAAAAGEGYAGQALAASLQAQEDAVVAAVVAALLVLWRPGRLTAAFAAVVAGGGLAALLAYRYVDVGHLGPFPDMYEPLWYAKKSWTAIAQAAATVAAVLLVVAGAGSKPTDVVEHPRARSSGLHR